MSSGRLETQSSRPSPLATALPPLALVQFDSSSTGTATGDVKSPKGQSEHVTRSWKSEADDPPRGVISGDVPAVGHLSERSVEVVKTAPEASHAPACAGWEPSIELRARSWGSRRRRLPCASGLERHPFESHDARPVRASPHGNPQQPFVGNPDGMAAKLSGRDLPLAVERQGELHAELGIATLRGALEPAGSGRSNPRTVPPVLARRDAGPHGKVLCARRIRPHPGFPLALWSLWRCCARRPRQAAPGRGEPRVRERRKSRKPNAQDARSRLGLKPEGCDPAQFHSHFELDAPGSAAASCAEAARCPPA